MTEKTDINDYISSLEMNGLSGRVLHIPPPRNRGREMLFVYGHHSNLERWRGVVQDLSQYGAVTMPDLPGFGGMDSFYKIGQKPTIDNLADYLAAFVKMRYKRKKVTIIGLSFGFVVATRMLQRYPDLVGKVEMLVSVVGFSHYDDFSFSKRRLRMYRIFTKIFSLAVPAWFFARIALNSPVLRFAYARTHNAKHKFADVASKEEFDAQMDVEVKLWRDNDVRTHMFTSNQFLRVNNCRWRVHMPVYHIYTKHDNYFDKNMVFEHLRVIFDKLRPMESKATKHTPSVVADAESAQPFIPAKLRKILDES